MFNNYRYTLCTGDTLVYFFVFLLFYNVNVICMGIKRNIQERKFRILIYGKRSPYFIYFGIISRTIFDGLINLNLYCCIQISLLGNFIIPKRIIVNTQELNVNS